MIESQRTKKYLIAKTFKKKGSAAILLEQVPDFLSFIPELESIFKRKAEFLIVSSSAEMELEEAWPEYAPILITEDKDTFKKTTEEKIS
ncbi:hypothetical protein LZ578_00015 [Jeotgalibaca sp. MA1X17-3]|uniref:DUF6718 family protein n=1 Tax=Jeotgalibaca sp. MA1X17-3 TaxID=2908211 RepID=UPI001F2F480B|nr:DUF6718 family protein [Jeotgalibaca sp. MA1X17-3]UJF15642.1 hypothetical protein LZ578_00015 [Jeotgalibaca sp. MA1X17-3]